MGHKSIQLRILILKSVIGDGVIDPEGLRYALNALYERYEAPLFILENGLGAFDVKEEDGTCHDTYRIDYLKKHIEVIKKTIDYDGVDIMGYTPWDLLIVHHLQQVK